MSIPPPAVAVSTLPLQTNTRPGPSLPLRADVLLSNSLFMELADSFTEEFCREYTGHEDLAEVDSLELQVDTIHGSQNVERLGTFMPNLTQMRLNESSMSSFRDLGTSLAKLRILWLCRSALRELAGITALPVLEELYVSFNDVRELTPVLTHERLQVLDLEGNLVEEFGEVKALRSLSSLRELNLGLNPFLKGGSVSRADILDELTQLEVLDDLPRDATPEEIAAAAEEAFDAPGPVLPPPLDLAAIGHSGAGSASLTPGLYACAEQGDEDQALQNLLRRAGRSPVGNATPGASSNAPGPGRTSPASIAMAANEPGGTAVAGSTNSERQKRGNVRDEDLISATMNVDCPELRSQSGGGSDEGSGSKASRSGSKSHGVASSTLAPLTHEGGVESTRRKKSTEAPFGFGLGEAGFDTLRRKKSQESCVTSDLDGPGMGGRRHSGPKPCPPGDEEKVKNGSGGVPLMDDLQPWPASVVSTAPAVAGPAGSEDGRGRHTVETDILAGKSAAASPMRSKPSSRTPTGAAQAKAGCERSDTRLADGASDFEVAGEADVWRTRGARLEVVAEAEAAQAKRGEARFGDEPNEQDLVVESLKRAPRPVPSLVNFASARGGGATRPGTGFGFLPQRRDLRTAWSSSGSSSTVYRPTSASTCTSSGMSGGWSASAQDSDFAASDLTFGDDALVGNPLAAVRRRRQNTSCGGGASAGSGNGRRCGEDLSIRSLLRTAQSVSQECSSPHAAPPSRLATPDVRIRVLTGSRSLVADSSSSAAAAGPDAPRRSSTASKRGQASSSGITGIPTLGLHDLPDSALLKPTYATTTGEVLLLE